jgi:mRNA-degrading endonuclease RelE of RelBE toxin-antitoxin system
MAEEEEGPARLIVFDSLDHMVPSEKSGDRRARETNAHMDGKSIAEERRAALWATTHAPKDVVNKIATAENVGESYDKARLADIVITINENKAMALKNQMKLYLAKYRQGKSRLLITVEVDKAVMTYKEIEEEKQEVEEDEE